jgi:hypothetical protein
MGFRVWGLGFRVPGSGFRVQAAGDKDGINDVYIDVGGMKR